MDKTATIGGAHFPFGELEANIPWEYKQKAYKDYLATKGAEPATGLGKSLLVGGGIGAGIGGLAGLTHGGGGALALGALGGVAGAGIGAMSHFGDKRDIAEAKEKAKDPERHLVSEMGGLQEERRHAEESDRHQRRVHDAALLAHVLTSDRGREVH